MQNTNQIIIPTEQAWVSAMPEIMKWIDDKRIILLKGDLGAGKTTLVKHLLKELGLEADVVSPTFTIVNEYMLPAETTNFKQVYHMDLYRLKDISEVEEIGIFDMIYGTQLCILEWPELIQPYLDESHILIEIEILESGRKVVCLSIE